MAKKGLDSGQLLVILLVVGVGLFLFGQFSEEKACTQANVDNDQHGCTTTADTYRGVTVPDNVDQIPLTIIKIVITFSLAWGGWALVNKAGGSLTKKDFATLIVIALAAWLLWDNALVHVLNAESLDSISLKVGQKLGVLG